MIYDRWESILEAMLLHVQSDTKDEKSLSLKKETFDKAERAKAVNSCDSASSKKQKGSESASASASG
jgi:hypothetical protein